MPSRRRAGFLFIGSAFPSFSLLRAKRRVAALKSARALYFKNQKRKLKANPFHLFTEHRALVRPSSSPLPSAASLHRISIIARLQTATVVAGWTESLNMHSGLNSSMNERRQKPTKHHRRITQMIQLASAANQNTVRHLCWRLYR